MATQMEGNQVFSPSFEKDGSRKSSPLKKRVETEDAASTEKDEAITRKREKNREKVKAWRMKQKKENAEKYDAMKNADKERKKAERNKAKLMASSDSDSKSLLRKKKAQEMKKYRQRKKLKAMASIQENGVIELKVIW